MSVVEWNFLNLKFYSSFLLYIKKRMMMSLSFHGNFDYENALNGLEARNDAKGGGSEQASDGIHLFAEKLVAPEPEKIISRPRLNEFLSKTLNQIGAIFIVGRAGTGKTSLAADFAAGYERIAWYRAETAETEWTLFARYLTASFNEPRLNFDDLFDEQPETFVEKLFARLAVINYEKTILIVLDDVHNVFDAAWFNDFFSTLVCSITPRTHLLLMARSSPDFPIWRLRSKQVIGVLDEKLLSFTEEETKKLFAERGVAVGKANEAWRKTFGRIAKIEQFVNDNRTDDS